MSSREKEREGETYTHTRTRSSLKKTQKKQVAILESIAIAKMLANRNKYAFLPNTELFSLGISNVIGCGFSAYAATGSFSRSAVIDNTGGLFLLCLFCRLRARCVYLVVRSQFLCRLRARVRVCTTPVSYTHLRAHET